MTSLSNQADLPLLNGTRHAAQDDETSVDRSIALEGIAGVGRVLVGLSILGLVLLLILAILPG